MLSRPVAAVAAIALVAAMSIQALPAAEVRAATSRLYVPLAARGATLDATPAAGATATPGPSATPARTATPAPSPTSATSPLLSAWLINSAGTRGAVYTTAQVNVQSVSQVTQNGEQYAVVRATGIPDYTTVMTSSLLASLRARPRASTDFRSGGGPSVSAGQSVDFGQDIGYLSSGCSSTSATGYGYWPPGPDCATAQTHVLYFPLSPAPATAGTSTGAGKVGFFVNGVSLFNWGDAQSYNNGGVWFRTAADWEKYDMDIDHGHSARGEYHHHFYPGTLAAQLGDVGGGHSPIFAFAADGYPIRGPWVADGTLAQSGWQTRDYDTAGSATGCGTAKVRSCLLVDQTDVSRGTTAAASSGPRTDQTISTANSNTVLAVSGVFQQDYYFSACAACLDQYNGHDHDGIGYHYHMTVTRASDGSLTPRYPYTVGPSFYGRVHSNSFAVGGGGAGGGGTGGGGSSGSPTPATGVSPTPATGVSPTPATGVSPTPPPKPGARAGSWAGR
jgi:hypothetical protein